MKTISLIFAVLLGVACGGARIEGEFPADCSDGADNDRDGLFDCSDPDCGGSTVCAGRGGAGGGSSATGSGGGTATAGGSGGAPGTGGSSGGCDDISGTYDWKPMIRSSTCQTTNLSMREGSFQIQREFGGGYSMVLPGFSGSCHLPRSGCRVDLACVLTTQGLSIDIVGSWTFTSTGFTGRTVWSPAGINCQVTLDESGNRF